MDHVGVFLILTWGYFTERWRETEREISVWETDIDQFPSIHTLSQGSNSQPLCTVLCSIQLSHQPGVDGSCFLILLATLYLFIQVFNSGTFEVVIDKYLLPFCSLFLGCVLWLSCVSSLELFPVISVLL